MKNTKIPLILLIFSTFFAITISTFASNTFSDVTDDTYYKNSINWMYENQVINGYQNGNFGPEDCVTRAEFLKMLYLSQEIDFSQFDEFMASINFGQEFSDVDKDQWYWPYISLALENETVHGYEDGTFKPNICVARVEAMKMAVLEFHDGEIPPYDGLFGNPYDVAVMLKEDSNPWWNDYYRNVMSTNTIGLDHFNKYDADWTDLGVESSFANPTFDLKPYEGMTRKEVAEMLYRMKALKDNAENYSFNDDIAPNSINLQNRLVFKEEVSNDLQIWKSTDLNQNYIMEAVLQHDSIFYPYINLTFNKEGAQMFEELTEKNISKRIGIFVVGELITAPLVNSKITGGVAIITGTFTEQEANSLIAKILGDSTYENQNHKFSLEIPSNYWLQEATDDYFVIYNAGDESTGYEPFTEMTLTVSEESTEDVLENLDPFLINSGEIEINENPATLIHYAYVLTEDSTDLGPGCPLYVFEKDGKTYQFDLWECMDSPVFEDVVYSFEFL